jgi:hypothetical protein
VFQTDEMEEYITKEIKQSTIKNIWIYGGFFDFLMSLSDVNGLREEYTEII